jgi:4-hydroxy-tetrahydrodipicolinate synthase
MSNDTTLRLADVAGVIGIKDATANIERATDLIKRAPKGFAIYSGEDSTALAVILLGGHGVISVTANVAPRLMHEMCAAALRGDVVTAREINMRLLGLHQKLFVEANPIPVKWALQQMGLINAGLRLPMTPLSENFYEVVRKALHEAGIQTSKSAQIGLRVVEGRG